MFTPNSTPFGYALAGHIDGVLVITYSFNGIFGRLMLNKKSDTDNKLIRNYRIYVDRDTPIPDNAQGDPITYLLRVMRDEVLKIAKKQNASVLVVIDGINETIEPILIQEAKLEGRPVINIDEDAQEIIIGG